MSKRVLILSVLLAVATAASAANYYVATDGNDSAAGSFAAPWLTPAKGFTSAAPGDTVFFRGGTYEITEIIETSDNVNPTSESGRVVFMNYNGETVMLDSSDLPDDGVGGNRPIYIGSDYYEINGLNATTRWGFLRVGVGGSANHFILRNSTIEIIQMGLGNNIGCITFRENLGDGGRVENCTFIGPGMIGNQNTVGIFFHRSYDQKVFNCEFYDWPAAIFYKWSSVELLDTGIEFAYNYFEDCFYGIRTVASYPNIHNNLLVNSLIYLYPEQSGIYHGMYPTVNHNTILGQSKEALQVATVTENGTVTNNILSRYNPSWTYPPLRLWPGNSGDHGTTTDYNLYPTNDAVRNNNISYTLDAWQTFYGQDANSVAGAPIFVGGGTYNDFTDYALTSSSPGYRASSTPVDGEAYNLDMGANVALVGASITQSEDPPAEWSAAAGAYSNGSIASVTWPAVTDAVYYLVRIVEDGDSSARVVGHTTELGINNIETSSATGTVIVWAYNAQDVSLGYASTTYGGN